MKIKYTNGNSINFKSKNNPVKPFIINTPNGELYVNEFQEKDTNFEKQSENLAKFLLDAFRNNTKDPWFLSLKDAKKFKEATKHFTEYYKSMFKKDDGNLTILIANNNKNQLCGAVVTNTLNESGVSDSQTCYIDSIAVSPEYRKCGVGRILLEEAISCSKDIYTDAFLISDNMAVDFEIKNGYKPLDYSTQSERKIIDKINDSRNDYPNYVTYMHKKLKDNNTNIPWAERIKINESSNLNKI